MASFYWIKLYHEILDDPKMATLPDRLWRRIIEIFLCAGRVDKNGELPPTNQIAWMLRMPADDIESDLMQIATTGIISRRGDGWIVNHFADRQSAVKDAERQRQSRDRRKKQEYYGDVTSQSRSVTQIRSDTDTDIATTTTMTPVTPHRAYEENIGPLTPKISDAITSAMDDYPELYIHEAIKRAVLQNKRSWAYIQGILRGMARDGLQEKTNGRTVVASETYG